MEHKLGELKSTTVDFKGLANNKIYFPGNNKIYKL